MSGPGSGPGSGAGSGGGPDRSKSNPFRELFDRLNRQFEDAARSWELGRDRARGRNAGRNGPGTPRRRSGRFDPRLGTATNGLDLAEETEAFVVTIDVPGYESGDLEVQLSGKTVSVSGERHLEVDEERERENYIRRERRSESFDRQVTLPAPVDAEDVDARVNNGVLTIRLPKEEPDEAHTIEIE